MEIKKGSHVTLWNGQTGIVRQVVAEKAEIIFDGQRRAFANLTDIVSAVDTYSEKDARFLQAKDRLAAFQTRSSLDMGDERVSTLFTKFFTAGTKMATSKPTGSPVATEILENMNKVQELLKDKMGLIGETAVTSFLSALKEGGFNMQMPPVPMLVRKYGEDLIRGMFYKELTASMSKLAPGKVDEPKWKRAEEAIAKSTGKSKSDFGDSEWAQVNKVYQNMGGTFHKKKSDLTRKAKDLAEGMVDAYIQTALWSSTDFDNGDEPLDANHGPEDLAPEAQAKAERDCAAFLAKAWEISLKLDPDYMLAESDMGHDFWLTRNHHGAGFWDGDYPGDLGDALTKLAEEFGDCDAIVGDDGKIYFEGGKDIQAAKTAAHANDFEVKYPVGTMLVPVETKQSPETQMVIVKGVDLEKKVYILEKRPVGDLDLDEQEPAQAYGVRYEESISKIDGDKNLRKYSKLVIEAGCPTELLAVSKVGQNIRLSFKNLCALYTADGQFVSATVKQAAYDTWEAVYDAMDSTGNAELTNRLIDNDPYFEKPEWVEYGTLDSVPVAVYYRTTPGDAVEAEATDWGNISWRDRIDRIVINLTLCDQEGISDEAINTVKEKYGIKTAAKKTAADLGQLDTGKVLIDRPPYNVADTGSELDNGNIEVKEEGHPAPDGQAGRGEAPALASKKTAADLGLMDNGTVPIDRAPTKGLISVPGEPAVAEGNILTHEEGHPKANEEKSRGEAQVLSSHYQQIFGELIKANGFDKLSAIVAQRRLGKKLGAFVDTVINELPEMRVGEEYTYDTCDVPPRAVAEVVNELENRGVVVKVGPPSLNLVIEKTESRLAQKLARLAVQGATNDEVITMFLEDAFPKDKMPVWGTPNLKITKKPNGWALVNYATPMLFRDNGGTLTVNTQKYSQSTSAVQKKIKQTLDRLGLQANETDGAGIIQAVDSHMANRLASKLQALAYTPLTQGMTAEGAEPATYSKIDALQSEIEGMRKQTPVAQMSDEQFKKFKALRDQLKVLMDEGYSLKGLNSGAALNRLAKKAARLGNWDWDVREGATWKTEAGDDGRPKLVRVKEGQY